MTGRRRRLRLGGLRLAGLDGGSRLREGCCRDEEREDEGRNQTPQLPGQVRSFPLCEDESLTGALSARQAELPFVEF